MNREKLLNLSIITIEKNYPEGLRRTLLSIASQEIPEGLSFSHLLCEGTPGVAIELIAELGLSGVSRICSSHDSGLYNGMNRGLSAVQNGWVLFLNAGDSLVPKNALQKIYSVLSNTEAAVVQFQANYSDETMRPFEPYSKFSLFFGKNMHIHPALFINLDIVKSIEFDETFKIAADYKLVNELIRDFDFHFERIAVSNFEGGGISSTSVGTLINEMNLVRILTAPKYFPRPLVILWNIFFRLRLQRKMNFK